MTDEQLAKFTSDFGIVANFFVKKRVDPNYVPDDAREIKHVDEVLKLLSAMTGDTRYQEYINERSVKNMCDVATRLENRGIEKGIEKGIEQGEKNLILKMSDKGVSAEKIAEMTDYDVETVKEIIAK